MMAPLLQRLALTRGILHFPQDPYAPRLDRLGRLGQDLAPLTLFKVLLGIGLLPPDIGGLGFFHLTFKVGGFLGGFEL